MFLMMYLSSRWAFYISDQWSWISQVMVNLLYEVQQITHWQGLLSLFIVSLSFFINLDCFEDDLFVLVLVLFSFFFFCTNLNVWGRFFFFFFFVLPENPKHFKKHWKDLVSSFFFPSSVLVYLLQDLKYTQPSALNGDIQKCLAILFPAAILKHALIYRNSLRASQKIPNMFCLGVHLKSIGTSMFPRLQILHGCISPIRSAVTLFHSQNEPF